MANPLSFRGLGPIGGGGVEATEEFQRFLESIATSIINAGWSTGDIKTAASWNAPVGWLPLDGRSVSKTTYKGLYRYLRSAVSLVETDAEFSLPDARGASLMGAGDFVSLFALAGENEKRLRVENLPSHSHTVTDEGHTHPVIDPGHTHDITDPGHSHVDEISGSHVELINMGVDTVPSYDATARTSTDTTGISINSAATGISLASAMSGIELGNTGNGDAFENVHRVLGVAYLIKV